MHQKHRTISSLDGNKCCVLVCHYHDDDVQGPEASVELSVSGLPWPDGIAHERHYRIDSGHSNSFEFWKRLGSPQNPTPQQYAQLEKAGHLAVLEERDVRIEQGRFSRQFELPRQAVSLIVIEK